MSSAKKERKLGRRERSAHQPWLDGRKGGKGTAILRSAKEAFRKGEGGIGVSEGRGRRRGGVPSEIPHLKRRARRSSLEGAHQPPLKGSGKEKKKTLSACGGGGKHLACRRVPKGRGSAKACQKKHRKGDANTKRESDVRAKILGSEEMNEKGGNRWEHLRTWREMACGKGILGSRGVFGEKPWARGERNRSIRKWPSALRRERRQSKPHMKKVGGGRGEGDVRLGSYGTTACPMKNAWPGTKAEPRRGKGDVTRPSGEKRTRTGKRELSRAGGLCDRGETESLD